MAAITYIDIHSHLHGSEFDTDREEVFNRLKEQGIATILIGTDYEESKRAVEIASVYEHTWATIGVHPNDIHVENIDEPLFSNLIEQGKVVAIGECGLDYYWGTQEGWSRGEVEEKNRQKKIFTQQIEIALTYNLPIVIHGRPSPKSMDAYEDILEILSTYKQKFQEKLRGDIHFFVGTKEIAFRFWELGFSMSFTGVITFTHQYDEVIRSLPLEAIMAETDSPYATPAPHRGVRNDSSFVPLIYQQIATLRNEDLEHVSTTLLKNANKLFSLQIS